MRPVSNGLLIFQVEMWRANSLSWLSLGKGETSSLGYLQALPSPAVFPPLEASFLVPTTIKRYIFKRRPSLLTKIQLSPPNAEPQSESGQITPRQYGLLALKSGIPFIGFG